MKRTIAIAAAIVAVTIPFCPIRAEDKPAESAKPAAPTADVKTFRHFVEAEKFDGVEICPINEQGQAQYVSGKWNRSAKDGTASGGHYAVVTSVATASHKLEVPADGTYIIWTLSAVHPELLMTFLMDVEQGGKVVENLMFMKELSTKEREDDNYIYRPGTGFAWQKQLVTLKKGEATLKLNTSPRATTAVCVDAFLIAGDPEFVPDFKPKSAGGTLDF